MEESMLEHYKAHMRHLSKDDNIALRRELFNSINGDIFYKLNVLPREFKLIFWNKPIGDSETFKLLLFTIGNGFSPFETSRWILTSQRWSTQQKAEKRVRQIDFVCRNLASRQHDWFYFDLYHRAWMRLSGEIKTRDN